MNIFKFFKKLVGTNGERGGVMLWAIIGSAVGLTTLKFMTDGYIRGFKATKKIELSQDKIQFRASILSALDCGKTLDSWGKPPIKKNGNLRLKNAVGTDIIPLNGKQLGTWYVRAIIEDNPERAGEKMIQVQMAQPLNMKKPFAGSGSKYFRTDPLNDRVVNDWKNSKSRILLPAAPICHRFFATNPDTKCADDEKIVGIDFQGEPICVDKEEDSCESGQKAVGLNTFGKVICADNSTAQECPNGQKAQGLRKDGSVICTSLLADQTCPAGYKQIGMNPNGTIECGPNSNTQNCPTGQKVIGTNSSGQLICGNNSTAKTCPYGYRVNGITNTGEVVCVPQHNTNIGCPTNQISVGNHWDGTPICRQPPAANKGCPSGQALRYIDGNSNPICVTLPSLATKTPVLRANSQTHGATDDRGPSGRATACCADSEILTGCSGGRTGDLSDNCSEDSCGYIGARPISNRCCEAAVDIRKEGASVAVWAICIPRY